MAKVRKDLRGRSLRKGEVQRSSDKRYMYTYTDPMGRRKFIYANDLTELREKEAKLMKDQLDGLDLYVAGKASVNDTFDRYMSTKYNLRESTRSSYFYTYDHYVRDTFGNKRIAEIKYSDVLQFYYYLLNEVKISLGTLDTVHCLLHPTFQLAVRDEIIRNNPTDGVMKEISRESGKNRGIRHALTVEQQRAFMEYIANHPIYYHWWPMFTVLLGTGCRIGEALGLRWQDLDYDRRTISINHSLSYYQKPESNKSVLRISTPKTEAGIRTIPMLDVVKDSFEMLYEEQLGKLVLMKQKLMECQVFIFCNRFGTVPNPQTVNHTIKRIANSYNADEVVRAKKERRDPIILPNFSCHHLRHTFCTRLCENETNLKLFNPLWDIETLKQQWIFMRKQQRKETRVIREFSNKLDVF